MSAPAAVSAPASAATPAPVRYGGFWRRFGAFWIDGILLWIAGAIVQVSTGADLFQTEFDSRIMFASFVSLVIGWLYCALLESGPRQATLGQMLVGVQVTDLMYRRISFARATGRHFGQIVSALLLGIGYLMIAFTEKKQGLHDMMAGCLVVRPGMTARP
ncbi:MAG: RDD family protein [Candidatus Eiseniibacteriota bacterium]